VGAWDRGLYSAAGVDPLLRRPLLLIPLSIGVTVLFMLVLSGADGFGAFLRIEPSSIAAALFLAIVPWFTDAARTFVWSSFLGRPVPYGRLLKVAAASELGAAVAPPFVGTVPVKTMLLVREGFSSGEALSLTTLSSLEDWIFYLAAAPFCVAAAGTAVFSDMQTAAQHTVRIVRWAALAVAVLGVVIFFVRRRLRGRGVSSSLHERWARFQRWSRGTAGDAISVYRLVARNGMAPFLLTLLLTSVQWGCRYSVAAVIVDGMGLPARPAILFALQIIIYCLSTIVPTPGGSGGAEVLFALLHRPYLPGPSIGVVTAAWRFATFSFPCLLAALVLSCTSLRPERRQPVNDASHAADG